MGNKEESRTEKVINEIASGGFTEDELNDIIEACETEIENK